MAGSGYESYEGVDTLSQYTPVVLEFGSDEFTMFCDENNIRIIDTSGFNYNEKVQIATEYCSVEQITYEDELDPGTGYPTLATGYFSIYTFENIQYSKNCGVNTPTQTTGVYRNGYLFTGAVNYHPDGCQSFIAVNHTKSLYYSMLLAPRCKKQDLRLEHLRVLHIPCYYGTVISTGIWHQPPLIKKFPRK